MLSVQVGDKVFCNWGAMHPTEERIVTKVYGERFWTGDNEEGFTMKMKDLRDPRESYRSPIGVYITEIGDVR